MLESAIEKFNYYQGRKAENLATGIYFKKIKKELISKRDKQKVDSQERAELNKQIMQAQKGIDTSKTNEIDDDRLLDCFKELFETL